ncbi:putative RNA-directed DNA polymerase [Helianthus annuus]|nr:putative RNA-directed DNA polymerase [Helianthus annuus]
MEALSFVINKAILVGEFKGVKIDKDGLVLSHMLYADDALILGEWSNGNVLNLARILRVFHICSGLKININKSNLYGVGTCNEETDNLAITLGCKRDVLPFEYLGIKVGANMNRCSSWKKVIEVFESRLALWKAKLISIGGRVTLIKGVLESLPINYFSLYKAPRKVLDNLERIMKKFLWSGSNVGNKMNWVSWSRITTPKKYGGLSIKRLEDVNEALIFKWVWRFRSKKETLWRRVIEVCHKSNNM